MVEAVRKFEHINQEEAECSIASSEQIFQESWSTLIEAREARALLAKRKVSPSWLKTPQKLRDEVDEILKGSVQIRGFTMLSSRPLPLRISSIQERISVGVRAHQNFCQRLEEYAQLQLEAEYGEYAKALVQVVKDSTQQVVSAFQGGCESEIRSAIYQTITAVGAPQIQEIKRVMHGLEILNNEGLVMSNVISLAALLNSAGISEEDARQEGRIALFEAIKGFDPSKAKFSAHASLRIRWRLLDLVRTERPEARKDQTDKQVINDFESWFEVGNGRKPALKEIELGIGMSEERVKDIKQLARVFLMGDLLPEQLERIVSENDRSLADNDTWVNPEARLLAIEAMDEQKQKIVDLKVAVALLSDRDAQIITRHAFEGVTLLETGKELGISESRVLQLYKRALLVVKGIMTKGVTLEKWLRYLKVDKSNFSTQHFGWGLKIKSYDTVLEEDQMLVIKKRVEKYEHKMARSRGQR